MAILVDQWYLRMTRSRRKLATLGLAYCLDISQDSCSSIVDLLSWLQRESSLCLDPIRKQTVINCRIRILDILFQAAFTS